MARGQLLALTVTIGIVVWACGRDLPSDEPSGPVADASTDDGGADDRAVSPPEASTTDAGCDLDADWGTPQEITSVNTNQSERNARLSLDELTMYFERGSSPRIVVATRPSRTDAFGEATDVAEIHVTNEYEPFLTIDRRALYFVRMTPDASTDILRASRDAALGPFTDVETVLGAPQAEYFPWVDGDELWSVELKPESGVVGIWRRPLTGDAAAPTVVSFGPDGGDDGFSDQAPLVADDGKTLYFASNRGNASALDLDVFVARRASRGDAFSAPERLSAVSRQDVVDIPTWLSPDGCRLYLSSNRLGTSHVFMAELPPR